MYLYEKLRKIRKANNKSSKDVAFMLGVSPSVYSRFESGQRRLTINQLFKFAREFDVPLDYLAYETEVYSDVEEKVLIFRKYLTAEQSMNKYIKKYYEISRDELYKAEQSTLDMLLSEAKKIYDNLSIEFEDICKSIQLSEFDKIVKLLGEGTDE